MAAARRGSPTAPPVKSGIAWCGSIPTPNGSIARSRYTCRNSDLQSKKSGYATIAPGAAPAVTSLVLLDKRVDRLAKAKRADRFVYASQDFDDSPDYFTSGPSLSDATQVTDDQSVHARVRVGTLGADRLQEQAWACRCRRRCSTPQATRRGASTRWSSTCTRSSRTACINSQRPRNATTTTPPRLPRAAISICSQTSCSGRAIRGSR